MWFWVVFLEFEKRYYRPNIIKPLFDELPMTYSRSNPSPRYQELIKLYREMHEQGDHRKNTPPEETFDGRSLISQAGNIRGIIEVLSSKTILDYGSGKGRMHERQEIEGPDGIRHHNTKSFWGVESITCYDPCYAPFDTLPKGKFDGVISTDVLEHCPREDLPWIIDEIFSFADEFVYMNVACFPAIRVLPNGENAHCTVESPEWWQRLFEDIVKEFPGLRYFASFHLSEKGSDGQLKEAIQMMLGKSKP